MIYDLNKCAERLAVKGWTQQMLAARAKVSGAVVSNFLNGKPVRNHTAKRIITALGLDMQRIVRRVVA